MIIPKGDPCAWLARRIKPGDVVIDVGANVGHFSEAMIKAGAKVHAIEPDPRCWKEFEERAPTAAIHEFAVGKACAEAPLTQGKDPAQSSLIPSAVGCPVGTVDVSVFTLDEAVPSPVATIKIDVQGGELDVLLGAIEHLKTCPLWVIEVWPHGLPEDFSTEMIYGLMDDYGMLPYTMEEPPQVVSYADLKAWVATAQQNSFVNLAWM